MPFGYVSAGLGAASAIKSLTSSGGGGQGPTPAGWVANAQGLTQLEGALNPQLNPHNAYADQYALQMDQASGLQTQAQQMAGQFNTGAQNLTNQQNALSGQITDAANAYLNSGNQAQYMAAMGGLVPSYYGAGNSAFNLGNMLQNQAGQAQGYGNQIMNLALDPQQALFNQQNQLQQQQALASQAARGIATSGVGAGLSNDATNNFLINWQNQQLGRATAGLQAYDANNQSIAGLAQGANQSYTTGLQDYTTGAGLPYNAAQTVYNNNQAAYGNQQNALTAQQAAFLAQQQTAQQGFANQAGALTGYQQALANAQNNLVSGNAWLNQNAANLMGYYNGSVPTWNQGQAAATANGYAGIGNYLGSGGYNNMVGNGQSGLSGAYNTAYINNAANNGDSYDYLANQGNYGAGTPYNAYAGASAWAAPTSSIYDTAGGAGDLAGFAALGG